MSIGVMYVGARRSLATAARRSAGGGAIDAAAIARRGAAPDAMRRDDVATERCFGGAIGVTSSRVDACCVGHANSS